ncbi:transposase [Paenibacillus zeirhizosphaerae]
MDNSSLLHTTWDCTYHIVFILKYRRKVMNGELRMEKKQWLLVPSITT